ncbi:serine hydrolase domain-containing protein [Solirubrobacter deserti]|uniref:Beta-lactamase family protein n=1 Tax=Solirubrobacter deserti TaxID=2282478 RepID=A0ABT4RRY2_9ACTN|nr:serine hydrolase domain-containing protein [Solirubrobacter deserti]MDA0141314.1 beta-lactamase family protein [Solirubrobacter deserti]
MSIHRLVTGAAVALATFAVAAPTHAADTKAELKTLVKEDGYPAALASTRTAGGRVTNTTAGVGNLKTRERVPVDGEVRIGSNTKTFTAVVVLQLVKEGKLELDAPVERYLPGLIPNGANISLRQLLNHTSGLPNYTNFLAEGLLPYQHWYAEPRTLLDIALKDKPTHEPGAAFAYSNTNYLVAGLIVEAITHRPIGEQITNRIIRPLNLKRTYFPTPGEERLRGPHPHGYHHDDPALPLTDVSVQDPSFGWAAGQMVSTPSELNRFFVALVNGRLLPPNLMREMLTTVPAPDFGEQARYGLGMVTRPLACGGLSYGHGGTITGYSTTNAATDDGRAAAVAVTNLPRTQEQHRRIEAVVERALCD